MRNQLDRNFENNIKNSDKIFSVDENEIIIKITSYESKFDIVEKIENNTKIKLSKINKLRENKKTNKFLNETKRGKK